MSYDGIVTKSVVKELKETILGGRIDKIYQPEKDEILINIHNKGINYKLLISATSNNPRLYLTDYSKTNPQTPPMFCMLLRKHLSGGIILNIEQYSLDRIVFIDISSLDELGQTTEKRLIIEIMGKHSNIMLIDKSSLKIIDSIKRVSQDMSRIRQILPGFIYENPPLNQKVNPLLTTKEEFFDFLNREKQNIQIYKFFYFNYMGLSPLISKEICLNANIDMDRSLGSLSIETLEDLYISFMNMVDSIAKESFNPLYITRENSKDIIAFHSLDLNQFGPHNKNYNSSISSVLDYYYKTKDTLDRIGQRSQSIRKTIGVKLERSLNKLGKQKDELLESIDREKFKIYGDLISANIHIIGRGVEEVELDNFYDENLAKILIPLDNKLSPSQNAQKYYKRYSKLKTAHQLLLIEIPETEREIEYLENVLMSIENSTEIKELEEIREELISENYIKDNSNKRKKKKEEVISKPYHYISRDNFNIYVGKNNRQNDYLTLKFAHREDLWLHVQNMPGSHVLIERQNREIPLTTLEEAAILAAYYSKGKNGSHIPVDYTERKNVRKAKNAKTGMVIYDSFKTITVTPSLEKINKIKKVD